MSCCCWCYLCGLVIFLLTGPKLWRGSCVCWEVLVEAEGRVAVMICVRSARLVLSAGMRWVWSKYMICLTLTILKTHDNGPCFVDFLFNTQQWNFAGECYEAVTGISWNKNVFSRGDWPGHDQQQSDQSVVSFNKSLLDNCVQLVIYLLVLAWGAGLSVISTNISYHNHWNAASHTRTQDRGTRDGSPGN